MKCRYSVTTNKILGFDYSDPAPTGPGYADVPAGMNDENLPLWVYNPVSEIAEMKTGQDLIDAQAIVFPRIYERLIKKYVGFSLNPVTLGQMEGMVDILVQLVNKWVNSQSPSQQEIDDWNTSYAQYAPYFKVALADMTTEAPDLTAAKASARAAEAAMKADAEWPSS